MNNHHHLVAVSDAREYEGSVSLGEIVRVVAFRSVWGEEDRAFVMTVEGHKLSIKIAHLERITTTEQELLPEVERVRVQRE